MIGPIALSTMIETATLQRGYTDSVVRTYESTAPSLFDPLDHTSTVRWRYGMPNSQAPQSQFPFPLIDQSDLNPEEAQRYKALIDSASMMVEPNFF
jgi:hypothetical protein